MRLALLLVYLVSIQVGFCDTLPVLRLKGENSCASGFVGPGGIWTTAHFSKSNCPFGLCEKLDVYDETEKDLKCGAAHAFITLPEFDVSLIRCTNQEALPKELPWYEGTTPKDITVVGFPKCGSLQLSPGSVTKNDGIFFSTSANGNYGSSGAPILTSDNKVVGMALSSASLFLATLSKITGNNFPLRAVSLRNGIRDIPLVPGIPRGLLLSNETQDSILSYYRGSVRAASGMNRLVIGNEFLQIGNGLEERFKVSPLSWRSRYISEIPTEALRELGDLAPIFFALLMEDRGPYLSSSKKLKLDDISYLLGSMNLSEDSERESREILTYALENSYSGFQLASSVFSIIVALFLGFFAAFTLWALRNVITWCLRSRRSKATG